MSANAIQLVDFPDLIDGANFDLHGMEGLDKKLISKVSLENTHENTLLFVEHMVTKESPFTELFYVGELGHTPDRARFQTDSAFLYFFYSTGEVFKSLNLKGLTLIATKIALDATKANSLALQLTYSVDRIH